MDDVFGPGGRLQRVLAAFEPRAEQAALARAVADALERGDHLLAEAGTGTGKSLAYLVPALASGRRVVVAAPPQAQPEQRAGHDRPRAAAARWGWIRFISTTCRFRSSPKRGWKFPTRKPSPR